MSNQHCGKHDKIFTEANPCPGCENEKEGLYVSSAQQSAEDAKPAEPVAKKGRKNKDKDKEENGEQKE